MRIPANSLEGLRALVFGMGMTGRGMAHRLQMPYDTLYSQFNRSGLDLRTAALVEAVLRDWATELRSRADELEMARLLHPNRVEAIPMPELRPRGLQSPSSSDSDSSPSTGSDTASSPARPPVPDARPVSSQSLPW